MPQKGSNFERDISRTLSLWWTDNKRNDVFWRNRLRATKYTPNAEAQLGDIIGIEEDAHLLTDVFLIELKCGYSKSRKNQKNVRNVPWDLLDVIDGDKQNNVIFKFWKQTWDNAQLVNKIPLLIFKRDYHEPVVCLYKDAFDLLRNECMRFEKIYLSLSSINVILISLKDFLDWIDPENIKHPFFLTNKNDCYECKQLL